jgi:hypothetical protein
MSDSNYEDVFKRKELHDMYALGEISPLDDLYLLEDVALTVKELDKKIAFYKDYKKKKTQDIADEVKVLENKISFYKEVMVSTLKKNKEKSIKFPGSCMVSSRNQKEKWEINDEEEFIAVLQAAKKAGEKIDDVLSESIQYKVKKKEANKLLFLWEQSGKLDNFLAMGKKKLAKKELNQIAHKEPPKVTVSIKFLEEEQEEVREVDDMAIPMKAKENNEDFDTL